MDRYSLDDLKLIYRVLHRHLEGDSQLLDSRFFEELQEYLGNRAHEEGVDVSDAAAWNRWVGR